MFLPATDTLPTSVEELLPAELLAQLQRMRLRTDRVFAGKMPGERRSKRRGSSVEFDDHRAYAPGDDLRRLDWSVYARFDRLVLKLFRAEEDCAVQVAVDASASMRAVSVLGDGKGCSKLSWGLRLAAALGAVGLADRNRVSASLFAGTGSSAKSTPEMRGAGRTRAYLERVIELGAAGDDQVDTPDPVGAIKKIARMTRGAGVLFVVSDFLYDDGYDAALTALAAIPGYDVCCVQVLTPEEWDPVSVLTGGVDEGAGRRLAARLLGDARLTDAETGNGKEVTVTGGVLAQYRDTVAAYHDRFAARCKAIGIACELVLTSTPTESAALGTLHRLGMLA